MSGKTMKKGPSTNRNRRIVEFTMTRIASIGFFAAEVSERKFCSFTR
jgi:hypothetical protein